MDCIKIKKIHRINIIKRINLNVLFSSYKLCSWLKEGVNMESKKIRKDCEELWAKNKYYVLSKSHKVYLEIREYLKEKEVDFLFLNEKIQRVRNIEESKKDFSNAILHVWGYFKNEATEIEKQGLCNLLQEYMKGKNNQKSVIEYINILLKKYPNEYLQKSTLLTGEKDETVA